MNRSMLRAAALWGVLLASATVAASSDEVETTTLVSGGEAPSWIEGKKCECADGCAMLKWMKGAMAGAVASGDGAKIAKALETVASKPVAGYGEWSAIAKQGAEAAKKGDIDGAKQSCKGCHSKYQKSYQDSKARCEGW